MKLSELASNLSPAEIVKIGIRIQELVDQGHHLYNYTVGDFDPSLFPIPEKLEQEIIQAYRRKYTHYPAAGGNADLKKALSDFYRKRQRLDYAPDEMVVGCGGRPPIYAAFLALCDPGDQILYPTPSWNNNYYVQLVKGQGQVIPTRQETHFLPTAQQMKPYIQKTRLIALCSPQNPTGTLFPRKQLEEICDLVLEENERRSTGEKKVFILYDQMYALLTYGSQPHEDPVSLRPALKAYTIYIDAISKAFAATGVRVGWALGPAPLIAKMSALLSHVGTWAPMAEQKALAQYLTAEQDIDRYLDEFRNKLQRILQKIHSGILSLQKEGFPVEALTPEATMYLTVKVDACGLWKEQGEQLLSQHQVTEYLLQEARIALVPFEVFGNPPGDPWYRLSAGTCKESEIPEMLNSLKSALLKLKKK